MPANLPPFGFDLAVRSSQSQPRRQEAGERFTLVVLGDFTGRASRGVVQALDARRVRRVDVDTFAGVLAQWGARLRLAGAAFPGGALELALGAIDDFHPDSLLAQCPWLAELAQARTLLLNPRTADQGRAALEACLQNSAGAAAESAAPPAPPESDADTFVRLLVSDKHSPVRLS